MSSDNDSNSSTIEEYFDAQSEVSDCSSSTIIGDNTYEDAKEEVENMTDIVADDSQKYQIQFSPIVCKHHMSFDENLMLRDILTQQKEWTFRKWFHNKNMTLCQLKRYYARHRKEMEECMEEVTMHIQDRLVCAWYASYDEIVTRFYYKLILVAVIPYGNISVDIILRQGENGRYLHLKLQGIQHHFAVDLVEIREEYLLNPHPRSLRNIKCPFRPLCFAKFEPTNSLFVLCQMGGQAILISLYPTDNFFYQYYPCII